MIRGRAGVYCGANAEEGEAGVALAQHANTFETTERLWKLGGAPVLGDYKGARRKERSGTEKCEDAAVFVGSGIRGIKENDIECRAGGSMFRCEELQGASSVKLQDSCSAADAEGIEVLLNESGSRRMIFDEDGFRCTAAQRLDANGAGTREDIKEAAGRNAFGDNVEERFAETIAGRAQSKTLKALELAAAKCPGNDAHGRVKGPQPTRAR